jgi:hypothetical protein
MEKRKRILELRDRLDRTLAMPDLAEEASLRALVKKQILASSLPGSDQGACLLSLLPLLSSRGSSISWTEYEPINGTDDCTVSSFQ